jgi:hypothetical protein
MSTPAIFQAPLAADYARRAILDPRIYDFNGALRARCAASS